MIITYDTIISYTLNARKNMNEVVIVRDMVLMDVAVNSNQVDIA